MADQRFGYRPALDGIRGLAIMTVIGGHAFGWPRGSHFGVDLFFVLSGFLITTLLLEERRNTGRISLARFYARRAIRLIPALAVMLAVFVIVSVAAGAAATGVLLKAGIGLTYVSNVIEAWVPGIHLAPLRHLWSLAEEEQFYLVWPVVLLLLVRWRARLLGPVLVLAIGAVCLERMILLSTNTVDGSRLYTAPDTHADPLLIGCLAGVIFVLGRTEDVRVNTPVFVGALIGAAAVVVKFGAHDVGSFSFGIPLFAACAAVLVLGAATGTWASRWLALRPLVGVGRISYALYLWHPVVLVAVGSRINEPVGLVRPVIGVLGALALATASWFLVERPALRLKRRFVSSRSAQPAPVASGTETQSPDKRPLAVRAEIPAFQQVTHQ